MKDTEQQFSEYKTSGFLLTIFFSAIAIGVTTFLINQITLSERKIFHLYFIPFIIGLSFEYKRLSKSWRSLAKTVLAAYLLSFMAFFPGRNHIISFDEHLERWVYYFILFFVMVATINIERKVTQKMTEGLTLLLTLAINYWAVEHKLWEAYWLFSTVYFFIGIPLSIFSIYSCFFSNSAARNTRLVLSIWSSLVIFILSVDNFLKAYANSDIESAATWEDKGIIFLQFVLLGISSMYSVQNIWMILPSKNQDNKEIVLAHLRRFSKEQTHPITALIVGITTVSLFAFNFKFYVLPTNIFIWLVIAITPIYISFLAFLSRRSRR